MGIPAAAQIMNAVVLTAVLSALNSGLYASSRMLFALTRRGDAPSGLARLSRKGVPKRAILMGTLFGYGAVVMSYVSPDTVFAFLVNSYGTVAIFVYVLIAVSQLRLRARLEKEDPAQLRVRMWGYPYLTYVAIAGMLGIVLAMAFIPDQRKPLLFGLDQLGAAWCWVTRARVRVGTSRSSEGLGRAIADDRGAMHDAPLRQIVRHRVMMGDAVIPEHHIVHAPMPADGEFRPRRMRKQEGKQRIALARFKFVDVRGESLVDEQTLASRDRMGAHHRMRDRRMLGHRALVAFLEGRIRAPTAGRERFDHRVLGSQAFEKFLYGCGQCVVGREVARPQRVPAHARQLLGGEDAGQRRRLTEGHVGVPIVVVRQKIAGGIDHQDLRQFGQHRINGMDVQLAEARREPALLLQA